MRTKLKIASLSLISVLLIGCSNEVDEPVNDEKIPETEEVYEDNNNLELKEKSTFITEAFATLLDYNNETYNDRSNDLQNYLNDRSEEHTSELQSRFDLVCRLL